MVKLLSILAFLVLFFPAGSQQLQDTLKIIPPSYSLSLGRPILLLNGDAIKVKCDSLYLLNTLTFSHFENLRELLNSPGVNCNEVMDLYKNLLNENLMMHQKLVINARETGMLDQEKYLAAQKILSNAQLSLQSTLSNLENATLSLEKTRKDLRRIKQKNLTDKILIGIGGIGVGILTGIMLGN